MIPVSQPLVAAEFLHGHYRASIMPWCVVQLLSDAQRTIVARFRKRNTMPPPIFRRYNDSIHGQLTK